MNNTPIKNIVIFKPSGADFCHNLAYKQLIAEHLNEDSFLTFEFKGNRIASFDSVQQPCLSVETETLTGTTTLSLRDNKPVVIIHGKTNLPVYALLRSTVPYFTIPVTSGYAEGLKIRFEPTAATQRSRSMMYRYNIIDEQQGENLGALLLPVNGSEMILAFEDQATDVQRRIIIGVSSFIIADTFRAKYLTNTIFIGFMMALFVLFMIYLYFQ